MFLLIIDKITGKIIFSTSFHAHSRIFKLILETINKIEQDEYYTSFDDFQIGWYANSPLLFICFNYLHNSYHEVDSNIILKTANDFSKIFSPEDIHDITNLAMNSNAITKKIINNLFPFDIEVRLFGESYTAISNIMNFWNGLHIREQYEEKLIIKNSNVGKKSIMLKKFIGPKSFLISMMHLLPKDLNILYIIDSTNESHLKIDKSIREFIETNLNRKKILILATNQNLPNAFDIKKIERTLGYPAIEYSTRSPLAKQEFLEIIEKMDGSD